MNSRCIYISSILLYCAVLIYAVSKLYSKEKKLWNLANQQVITSCSFNVISFSFVLNNKWGQVVSLTSSHFIQVSVGKQNFLSLTAGIFSCKPPHPSPDSRGRHGTCLLTHTDVAWHWIEPDPEVIQRETDKWRGDVRLEARTDKEKASSLIEIF